MRDSKLIRTGLIAFLLGFSSLANAQFFIGADGTSLGAKIDWNQPVSVVHTYDLTLARVRVGYQGDFFGFEVHAYSKDDDTSESSGYLGKLELDTSYGAYLRMQEKWVYARLGVTWFDTYYTLALASNPSATVTDRDVIAMPTFALGIEVPLGQHIGINLDYTYADGKANYPAFSYGSPTMRIQGPALGLTVKF
jgi:hypothetical protein